MALLLVRGYDELIGRLLDLSEHPEVTSKEQEELKGLLNYHRTETTARSAIHDHLAAVERNVKAYEPLQREAESQGIHVAEVADWPKWRHEAQRLEKAGRAILADDDTYGAWLDAVIAGKPCARLALDQLHRPIEDGRVETVRTRKPAPRPKPTPKQEEGIAYILDDPTSLRELREQLKKRERKIGR